MSKPITEPIDLSNCKDLFIGPSMGDGLVVHFMVDNKYYFADWVDMILDNSIEELTEDEYITGLQLITLYHNTENCRLLRRTLELVTAKRRLYEEG